MFRKVTAIVGAAMVIALLGLLVVGSVFAQEPTPTPKAGGMLRGAWGRIHRGVGVISEAVTELLGMTREEIYAERLAGKTLAEIAAEKGVSDQQLIDALLAGQKEAIAQALEEGRITQEQADWLLAKAEAMAPLALTNPFAPREGRWGVRGMRGRGCWGRPTPTPEANGS